MYYGSTKLETNWPKTQKSNWKIRLLSVFIPKADPDNELLYPLVDTWLLEVDDNGKPNREIGLDKQGVPIFSAPDHRNSGLWTDSPVTVDRENLVPIKRSYFEAMWVRVARNA